MNEIGIDSLSLSQYMPLTQTMVDQIAFMIQKNGFSSLGGSSVGKPEYFHQTFTTYDYFQQNVQLMQQNNKPIGAYFFSYAWDYDSAYYEATLECTAIDGYTYKPDWPIFIDWEQGSRNAVVAKGFSITPARMEAIVHGWRDGCYAKGYRAGFYTGAAIARDDFGATLIQSLRDEDIYFWEAHYKVQTPYIVPYDIWQYYAGESNWGDPWMGTVVDWNKIGDDRMWNISPSPPPPTPPTPTPSTIPIWLKIKMAQGGSNNGKCTLLL